MQAINALVPELECLDFEASLHFYVEVLGFSVVFDRPESKFAYLALGQAQIMLKQANGFWKTAPLEWPLGRGINLMIAVEKCETVQDRLKGAGITLFEPPETVWYRSDDTERGQIEFLVQDPDGYLLRFSQFLGVRPAGSQ